MKLTALILAIAFLPNIVSAEWELASTSENGEVTYIDRITKVSDNIIEFWSLTDSAKSLKKTQNLSSKTKYRGDCLNLSSATIYILGYSGYMGSGTPLDSYEPRYLEFKPVVPGSVGESMLAIACIKAGVISPAVQTVISESAKTPSSEIQKDPLTLKPAKVENPKFKLTVKAIQANARLSPDSKSKILGIVDQGAVFEASSLSDRFYKINTSNGDAYIHESTVDAISLTKTPKNEAI